ncbi:MAG: M64 family metallopeptidase [Paludibacter sp.]|nr:M64 family metallopeptidase [Paludibacter sp.]
MYRPYYDCRMQTNEAPAFCPVCEKAVERVILFLTE